MSSHCDSDRKFSAEHPYLIAEIGTAHQGDLAKAKELILAAAAAGADCIKTQIVFADEILHPDSGRVQLPGGATPLFQKFCTLERPAEFFAAMQEFCRAAEVDFLCSPFGVKSAAIVGELRLQLVKIASPELNHYPLLTAIGAEPTLLLSAGVSTLADIEECLSRVKNRCVLLHCSTAYPTPPEQYNVSLVRTLADLFGVQTGISDHSQEHSLVPLLALACGAVVIEKHFTLSCDAGGLDDPIALPPAQFSQMTANVRRCQGNGYSKIIAAATAIYGEQAVDAALGDGCKRLSAAEMNNYATSNRSIMALKEIRAGDRLTLQNIALLRSEKNLTPGLPPRYWSLLLGTTAVKNIACGAGIDWSAVLAGN